MVRARGTLSFRGLTGYFASFSKNQNLIEVVYVPSTGLCISRLVVLITPRGGCAGTVASGLVICGRLPIFSSHHDVLPHPLVSKGPFITPRVGLDTNTFNRETRKITRQSFLGSQRTCRSARRVLQRSACANDARRCSSRSGHFSSGLPMSVCGIRGRCPRRGTTPSLGRQGWLSDQFCMWHGGHSSGIGARLMFEHCRILFARRMMQIWYSWKGNREGLSTLLSTSFPLIINVACSEKTLQEVLKKQRNTVEEIKKKTNYYSTRNLIEKYDEPAPLSSGTTPLRRRHVSPSPVPQTPLAPQPPPVPPRQVHLQTPNGQARAPVLQLSRSCYCPLTTRSASLMLVPSSNPSAYPSNSQTLV